MTRSTVAKEAGHSRTLIAIPGKACAFPEIRQRIENLKTRVANPTNSNDTISVLRTEVKSLKQKLLNQQHQWRADQTARSKAEAERDHWKKEFNRLLRKNAEDNAGNILNLVPSDES
jgi:predicted metal-dependent hydrolase